jgi:hypothetical protein
MCEMHVSRRAFKKKRMLLAAKEDDKILCNIRLLGAEVLWCGAPARMKTRFEDVAPLILPPEHGSVPGTGGKTTIETAPIFQKLTQETISMSSALRNSFLLRAKTSSKGARAWYTTEVKIKCL